ncbi:MAG: hypothetical protein QF707_05810, partial [Candidatus Poseidoniaceae archaeon]|nr:hypothetical protein [Candidatus Poseidoniaceae archaeon]
MARSRNEAVFQQFYFSTLIKYYHLCFGKGHPRPPRLNRSTTSTAGCWVGCINGEMIASAGISTSNNAPVGHELIHERQPTQFVSTTISGL